VTVCLCVWFQLVLLWMCLSAAEADADLPLDPCSNLIAYNRRSTTISPVLY